MEPTSNTFSADPGRNAPVSTEKWVSKEQTDDQTKPSRPAKGKKAHSGLVEDRIQINIWLSAKEAAKKISTSTDTIERRGIPWQENPVKYKVRFKYLVLDGGADAVRRYFEPDIEALVVPPDHLPSASRPRIVPRFSK